MNRLSFLRALGATLVGAPLGMMAATKKPEQEEFKITIGRDRLLASANSYRQEVEVLYSDGRVGAGYLDYDAMRQSWVYSAVVVANGSQLPMVATDAEGNILPPQSN